MRVGMVDAFALPRNEGHYVNLNYDSTFFAQFRNFAKILGHFDWNLP